MRHSAFTQRLKASLENHVEPEAPAVDPAAEPVVEPVPPVEEPVVPAEPVEDTAIVAAPEGGEEVIEVVDPTELEGELIAADDEADAADDVYDEVEEIEEAAEGLESILNTIQAAGPQGLTPSEATWANVAIESYIGKYLPEGQSLTPSVESFGGTTSRAKATASLEANVVETIKQAWGHILELLKKAYEFVRNHVARIFDAAEALLKRAEALKARAAKLEGSPKEASIEVGSLPAGYSINGKVPSTLPAVFQNLDHLLAVIQEMDTMAVKRTAAAISAINKAGATGNIDEAKKELDGIAIPSAFKYDHADEKTTDIFPGENQYGAGKIPAFTIFYRKTKKEVEAPASKMQTLAPAVIGQVASEAAEFAKKAIALKAQLKVVKDESANHIVSAIEAHGTKLDNNGATRFLAPLARSIATADRCVALMFADAIRAARDALAVAEKSAAQYGHTVPAAGTKQLEAA